MRDEHPKIKLNFRVSSKVFEKMQALVDNGEFEDISDVIVSALHQLLERSEKKEDIEDIVLHYLESEKGREMIQTILLREERQLNVTATGARIPTAISDIEHTYTIKRGKKTSVKRDR